MDFALPSELHTEMWHFLAIRTQKGVLQVAGRYSPLPETSIQSVAGVATTGPGEQLKNLSQVKSSVGKKSMSKSPINLESEIMLNTWAEISLGGYSVNSR